MGLRPVAELQFIDFITTCFDMITSVAATSRYRTGAGVPIVVRGPCGAGVSGGPFHSANPEAFFLNTAGIKIVEPSTPYDAKGLLKAAIRDDDPVLFFEHKLLYRRLKETLPADEYVVPIGKAIVRRTGGDLTIVTFGAMVHVALDAAEALAKDGVEVEVLDLRTLAPLDRDAILDLGRQDEQGHRAARGQPDRRHRRRNRGHRRGRGISLSRRPGGARRRVGRAGALQPAARKGARCPISRSSWRRRRN